jgi:hypothetical protein
VILRETTLIEKRKKMRKRSKRSWTTKNKKKKDAYLKLFFKRSCPSREALPSHSQL